MRDLKPHESMNINVAAGTKLYFTNTNGYDHQRESAAKFLEVGKEYTLEYIDVGSWSSSIKLVEFPDREFNSVMFVTVNEDYETYDWFGAKRDEIAKALEAYASEHD